MEPGPNAGNDEQAEQGVPPEQPPAERLRDSRHALSSCNPVPQWLQERFAMPSDCTIIHMVHTSKMLPHFQVRLGSGKVFQRKDARKDNNSQTLLFVQHPTLSRVLSRTVVIHHFAKHWEFFLQLRASTSASYNPDLAADSLDETKKTIGSMTARHRSQLQAWYMCFTWASDAAQQSKKRKRGR